VSVLSRAALEASPLADLHAIASELGIDSFRRLRREQLVDAILARQAGLEEGTTDEDAAAGVPSDEDAAAGVPSDEDAAGGDLADEELRVVGGADATSPAPRPRRRGGRRGRARDADPEALGATDGETAEAEEREPERVMEGVVELLGNGSGFLRLSPPEPSDEDVYVSAAQVRRCELVDGDRVSGPVRAPRRSERHPSLVRVQTINGRSAEEVAEGIPFDDLPASFPTQRLALGGEEPTLKAIEWLTPLGRGSRVTLVGPARAGKTEALRRLAGALAPQEDLELSVVLAGVRPEEVREWQAAGIEPVAALGLAAAAEAQAQAIERALETARRIAARGADAVVLVDTLDGLGAAAQRRALAAARKIVDGGSLTVVATASHPVGGETTVITFDAALTSTGRFPALDLVASGTLRAELLVGEAGADAIAQARAAALG
jgi:transcription termination factor Rho